jgi:hypothetical protein
MINHQFKKILINIIQLKSDEDDVEVIDYEPENRTGNNSESSSIHEPQMPVPNMFNPAFLSRLGSGLMPGFNPLTPHNPALLQHALQLHRMHSQNQRLMGN